MVFIVIQELQSVGAGKVISEEKQHEQKHGTKNGGHSFNEE